MPGPFAGGFGAAGGLLTEPRPWDPGLALLDGPSRDEGSSPTASELARPLPSESDIRENETVRGGAEPDSTLCFRLPLSELLGEFAFESAFRFNADLSGGGGAAIEPLGPAEFAEKSGPAGPAGWRALCAVRICDGCRDGGLSNWSNVWTCSWMSSPVGSYIGCGANDRYGLGDTQDCEPKLPRAEAGLDEWASCSGLRVVYKAPSPGLT
jgi:hypothetical protein